MPEKISRRELAKRGLLGAAALAVPAVLKAQDTQEKPKVDPDIDRKIALIESKLAKPLSDRARELLKASISNNENNSTNRLKHKLPENSEPCFVYHVTLAGDRP
ncbi:MAG: hypothetical protein QOJ65_2612 [Fimbriimonadaceae bacterium]|jgi:hypothetical protein|nr:hypothetical protein [Fimbriimonadaceae bacterium]